MKSLRILKIYPETISDGYGVRFAIYFAGCAHRCVGCHNPQSRDPQGGEPLTEELFESICEQISENSLLDGITLSGGDPLYNAESMLDFLRALRERSSLPIWCYTGYTLEECLDDPAKRECLKHIDTLVDGRYEEQLNDPLLRFRGSSNQRIIDIADLVW